MVVNMAKKSSNNIGNPYHDEKTGEFTSPDSSSGMETTKPKLKLKLKEGGDIQGLINDINQCSNVPFLSTSTEIEQNIESFFSKPVIEKIDSLYGDPSNVGCASYQFRPKSNPHIRLEIFPNVLGKYRYKDNRAHIVSAEEFDNYKGTKIYRGISSSGEKARSIVNSYGKIDLDNFDYYCPNGGNCYGSNIYTTVDKWYAQRYAGYSGTLIEGKIDESSSKHIIELCMELMVIKFIIVLQHT